MACYENNQTSHGRSDSRRTGRAAGQNPAGSQPHASTTGDAGRRFETHSGAVGSGRGGNSIIRVHPRVPDVIDRFDLLVPEPVPSPVAQLKMAGRKRQRASTVKPVKPSSKKWQWGDEQ
jgi:hypothetical protein